MDQRSAATTVIETISLMAAEQRPLMLRVLPESGVHFWKHYPPKDARDKHCQSRWYYHVHKPGDRHEDEHGHFHLFLHRTQMKDGTAPVAIPKEGEDAKAKVVHLAGLSIDTSGIPREWFTTNRWVTNEFMYDADTLIDHLDRYNVDATKEDDAVNRFLTAMVALYRDDLAELLRERDAELERLGALDDAPERLEKGNDILSRRDIDLDAKIEPLGLF